MSELFVIDDENLWTKRHFHRTRCTTWVWNPTRELRGSFSVILLLLLLIKLMNIPDALAFLQKLLRKKYYIRYPNICNFSAMFVRKDMPHICKDHGIMQFKPRGRNPPAGLTLWKVSGYHIGVVGSDFHEYVQISYLHIWNVISIYTYKLNVAFNYIYYDICICTLYVW